MAFEKNSLGYGGGVFAAQLGQLERVRGAGGGTGEKGTLGFWDS